MMVRSDGSYPHNTTPHIKNFQATLFPTNKNSDCFASLPRPVQALIMSHSPPSLILTCSQGTPPLAWKVAMHWMELLWLDTNRVTGCHRGVKCGRRGGRQ